MRPRNPDPRVRVRNDGKCFLNCNALEQLDEKSKLYGYKDLHICWQIKNDTIIMWPCNKNDYSSKVNISGPRKTIQFTSKRLSKAVKDGTYKIEII